MINNTDFKRMTISTTTMLVLPEAKKRKSWMIQNTDNSDTFRISNYVNGCGATFDFIEIPPNSVATAKIPEDNPREPIYGRFVNGSAIIQVYQAYSKEY